jgi:hypothetical protein
LGFITAASTEDFTSGMVLTGMKMDRKNLKDSTKMEKKSLAAPLLLNG